MNKLVFMPECFGPDPLADPRGLPAARRAGAASAGASCSTRTPTTPSRPHGPARAGPLRRPVAEGLHDSASPGRSARARRPWSRRSAALWPEINLAVITNDIYTHEDAEFLSRREVLPVERIVGVQTGGCPHTAIRDDASANLERRGQLPAPVPRPRAGRWSSPAATT